MKAEITISQLWWNPNLMSFFFHKQSKDTLEELVRKANCETAEDVFNAIEMCFDDLDDCEEVFYYESLEDIAKMLGLELSDDEDDDEDNE